MFYHKLFISLVLPYMVYGVGKYTASPNPYSRDNAKAYCEGLGTTLATILSPTDQHDARRNECPRTIGSGCWIGVTLPSAPTGPYAWDDNSAFTAYGFTLADPSSPTVGQGPWYDFDPNEDQRCIRLEADLQAAGPESDTLNRIWADTSCDPLRRALCNVPTPDVELFHFGMHDATDSDQWQSNDNLAEQPISTSPDRCEYAAIGSTGGNDGSVILDNGCWSICANNNPQSTLTHFSSTYGYNQCQLQYNIDPWSTSNEGCKVLVTNDMGGSWQEIGGYDSDDADTQFVDLGFDYSNQFGFGVQFMAPLSDADSCCYFNEVYLRCNTICTDTGDDCTDGCQCCEATDVCRSSGDDTLKCQECLETGSNATPCSSTPECCSANSNDGIICGIDSVCCITAEFSGCGDDNDCCGDLRCKDNPGSPGGICTDCIDVSESESCSSSNDCCGNEDFFGIVCGANNRCCISEGFQCDSNADGECCDGLTCNNGKCQCIEECKIADVKPENTNLCSSTSECCDFDDPLSGILCGKESKCCIAERFSCIHSWQCCDDLVCNVDWKKCVHPTHHHPPHHGGGNGGGYSGSPGHSNRAYMAIKEESRSDNMDNSYIDNGDNNNNPIDSIHYYLWAIFCVLFIIIVIILISCYYKKKNNKKEKSPKMRSYIASIDDIEHSEFDD